MKLIYTGLASILGLGLVACANQSNTNTNTSQQVTSYSCEQINKAELFDVDVYAGKSANDINIVLAGQQLGPFTMVEAASGTKYVNNNQSIAFWSKGYEAIFLDLKKGGQPYIDCSLKP